MPSHQHNHLHKRQGDNGLEKFVDGVESAASDLNPFKSPATLQARAPAPSTVFFTVYETMSKTFDGPIAGYSTVVEADDTTKVQEPTIAALAQPTSLPEVENTSPLTVAQAAQTSLDLATSTAAAAKDTDILPGSIMQTGSVDLSQHSTLAIATSRPTTLSQATKNVETSEAAAATRASASSSSSATATAESSNASSSSAAKAGIAIGVLGGILVVGLLVFFLMNKRRKQLQKEREDNEKVNHGPYNARPMSMLSTQTSATAPQLSLRPLTEFMPAFSERRSSKGAHLALATGNQSLWERPGTSHANNTENPFGNHAERVQTPTGNGRPTNPFDNPENVVGVAQTTNSPPRSVPTTGGTAVGAGAGALSTAAAGAALVRKASARKNAPAPLDLTMPATPPSPAGTEFSINSVAPGQSPGPSKSAAAIAAAGGPSATVVHRVQLDFKPTLEDEMGLKAGQLVRLIHEYDDGWSMCISLDRSVQGVVPRTCLSTRPVKPRPAGGPGARNGPPINPSGQRGPRGPGPNYPPGARPMTPQSGRPESPMMRSMAGRPQSPATMRPHSPATGRPMSPYGSRPASPATGRPMSPGPQAQSPASRQQRRMTPPGPSPMNPNAGSPTEQQNRSPGQGAVGRKPVPGQAY